MTWLAISVVFPLWIDCGIEFVGHGLLRVANWAADRVKVDAGRLAVEGGRVGRKR